MWRINKRPFTPHSGLYCPSRWTVLTWGSSKKSLTISTRVVDEESGLGDVIDVLAVDFKAVDGFGAGSRGDAGQQRGGAGRGFDLLAGTQPAGRHKLVPRGRPEGMLRRATQRFGLTRHPDFHQLVRGWPVLETTAN